MLTLDRVIIRQGDFALSADLTLPKGAITAIIGPSGAGKSTLLSAIAGFLPVSGRIAWDGTDLGPLPPGKRPLAMLFQDNNLFPHLTAAQNVALALTHRARLTEAQRDKVTDALARTGLSGLEDRKPSQLSGGQQSRVALARVLLQDKPLLLLDEPFSALGPALKSEMLDLVATLARDTGQTVLMITHDPADARRIADHTLVVADGTASPPQPTKDLFANPPKALRTYLGTA
ncbi:ATP-binding cassette domain-containing protein [Mesobacterium pallidum]|uniref:thiamine ABC transporter ATP-binding protein n=1 Tax=Mesobacterium pallidum TaxID=2872037 RepID=UPI001EE1F29E|nr:ATP-binding cassette domain-containing protein [Mesobacterium pallidum]